MNETGERPETRAAAARARQQAILDYLTVCAQRGEHPTMRDITAAVGLATPSAVGYHLQRLEAAGQVHIEGVGKFRRITAAGGQCMTCGQHLPERTAA